MVSQRRSPKEVIKKRHMCRCIFLMNAGGSVFIFKRYSRVPSGNLWWSLPPLSLQNFSNLRVQLERQVFFHPAWPSGRVRFFHRLCDVMLVSLPRSHLLFRRIRSMMCMSNLSFLRSVPLPAWESSENA